MTKIPFDLARKADHDIEMEIESEMNVSQFGLARPKMKMSLRLDKEELAFARKFRVLMYNVCICNMYNSVSLLERTRAQTGAAFFEARNNLDSKVRAIIHCSALNWQQHILILLAKHGAPYNEHYVCAKNLNKKNISIKLR